MHSTQRAALPQRRFTNCTEHPNRFPTERRALNIRTPSPTNTLCASSTSNESREHCFFIAPIPQQKDTLNTRTDSLIERCALNIRTPIPLNSLCASSTRNPVALGNPVAIGNASNTSDALKQHWRSQDKHLGTYDFTCDSRFPNRKTRNGHLSANLYHQSADAHQLLCVHPAPASLWLSTVLWLSAIP